MANDSEAPLGANRGALYGVGKCAALDVARPVADEGEDAAAADDEDLSDALLNGVGGNRRFGVASALAYGGPLRGSAEDVDVEASLLRA